MKAARGLRSWGQRDWSNFHQRVGERLEQGYADRVSEVATELAMHFERGRDDARAVSYLQQAAETALQRHAHQEAVAT